MCSQPSACLAKHNLDVQQLLSSPLYSKKMSNRTFVGLGSSRSGIFMCQMLGEPNLRGAANDVYRDTSIVKGVQDPQVGQPS